LFKDDRMRDELAFSRTLSPKQRRVVHLVAQKLGVYHYSVGEGEERYAVVTRIDPNRQQGQRHTLSRAPSAYLTPSANQVTASSLRAKKSMPDMKTCTPRRRVLPPALRMVTSERVMRLLLLHPVDLPGALGRCSVTAMASAGLSRLSPVCRLASLA